MTSKIKISKNKDKYMRRFAQLVFFLFVLVPSQSFSASTDWQDLGGGKARLIANLNPETNVLSGAIEVQLEPGWKTYWRYPGSSGIPPIFDFSKSEKIGEPKVQFPTPNLMKYDNGTYAGYESKVMFPFEAKLSESNPGDIKLNLLIGVCATICIPAQAEMTIGANALLRSDPIAKQLIQLAKLSLPKKTAPNQLIVSRATKGENILEIIVNHKAAYGAANLFVEGPEGWFIEPAKLIQQKQETAVFHLDISDIPKNADPLKEKLRFTLSRSGQGIETLY